MDTTDTVDLFQQRRIAASGIALGHELPNGRRMFLREPGWTTSPDRPDVLTAPARMPGRFLEAATNLVIAVTFEPHTAVPRSFSCRDLGGMEIGDNSYLTGRGFRFHHPGAPPRTTWSDALLCLHAQARQIVQPRDEVAYASLLAFDEILDYTTAIDRELPGIPVPIGDPGTMLHDGPDTPVGRALFNCIRQIGNDQLWYCQAVATLWIAHGEKIEENCILTPPQPIY